MHGENQSCPSATSSRWWREWEVAALALLVLATYFTRLTAVPVCGEESRWATAAREMIASGDWIVPRQQGDDLSRTAAAWVVGPWPWSGWRAAKSTWWPFGCRAPCATLLLDVADLRLRAGLDVAAGQLLPRP